MRKIVFATNNKHKLQEVRAAVCDTFDIIGLDEIGFHEEIPEDQETLQGNASQKSHFIYDRYHLNCFADDTGLEVEALNGAPGVYSARYAGEGCSFENNIKKLLMAMEGKTNRNACFRTVISLILEGKEYFFEGKVEGKILTGKMGEEGFGYDPVFQPNGFDISFAQMSLTEKNKISHRGQAVQKLTDFLNKK